MDFLILLHYLNLFLTNVPISYPLKTPEKLWFPGDFRGYKIGTLGINELTDNPHNTYFHIFLDERTKRNYHFHMLLSPNNIYSYTSSYLFHMHILHCLGILVNTRKLYYHKLGEYILCFQDISRSRIGHELIKWTRNLTL